MEFISSANGLAQAVVNGGVAGAIVAIPIGIIVATLKWLCDVNEKPVLSFLIGVFGFVVLLVFIAFMIAPLVK